jgi:hypothetical protein
LDEHEDGTAEAGQAAGHQHGDRLQPAHVDAERLGRDRILADRAEAQAERRPPEDPPAQRDEGDAEDDHQRHVAGRSAQHPREVRHGEPVPLVQPPEHVGRVPAAEVAPREDRQVEAGHHPLHAGRLRGPRPRDALEHDHVQVPSGAGAEEVDGDAGHDVVDPEPHGGDRVQEAAERAADDAHDHRERGAVLDAAPGPEPHPEDHHPLEPDVDDAGPLGPETTEAGEADGQREPQRGAERPRPGQGGVVRHVRHGRQSEEDERAERDGGATAHAASATRSSSTCADTLRCWSASRMRRTTS